MDQAAKLRNIINSRKSKAANKFKVITVSSGKGGVGKTNFVINLAIILRKRGLRVTVLDADFGMANVDILFGIKTTYSIYDILYNNKTIDDVTVTTDEGIRIIPGGSGIKELIDIDDTGRERLLSEFSKLEDTDILLIDTGAGISKTILNFVEFADDLIIITNPEPTSITDAYSLIKVIYKNSTNSNIGVVINRCKNIKEAKDTFGKLSMTVNAFLGKKLKYLGFISEDSKVGQAVREQKPFLVVYPKCEAGLCIQRISSEILGETDNTKNNSIREYINKLLKIMER